MTHLYRAVEGIVAVETRLSRGRGTTKAERHEMVQELNAALAALKSSIYHSEVQTLADFERARVAGVRDRPWHERPVDADV